MILSATRLGRGHYQAWVGTRSDRTAKGDRRPCRPPVLFIHGLWLHASSWQPWVDAQKLLGENRGAAAIAIDAAPIKGVLPLPLSTLRATLPVLANPANSRHAISLTAAQFRYAFGNAMPEGDFSPRSPAKVKTDNSERGPLLLIMGGQDHTVPAAVTKSTLKQYRGSTAVTDLVGFADRRHSLVIDSGWRAVADECLVWLAKQGL